MKKTLCVILWLVLIGVAFAGPHISGGKSGGGGTSTATLTGNTPNTVYGSNGANVQGWYNSITISDDTRQFANSADSTKGVKIDASNQGAGQTGTIQAPVNGTATLTAGTGVTTDGTQTLTNKSIPFIEVNGSTTANMTAANVSRTFINSYGRAGAVTLTLPTAAAGYSFVTIVGTKHNSLWAVKVTSGDSMYWDSGGVLTSAQTNFGETNQEIGSRVSCSTFQTGASIYSWLCGVVSGTWTTNNL